MIWSKTKREMKSLIVPELRDRIDIHCTTYRKAHDLAGEEWITIDGQRVFYGGCCHWHKMLPKAHAQLFPYGDHEGFRTVRTDSEIVKEIQQSEVAGINHIWDSLRNYLHTPVQDSLASTNPIFRAFAIVDRRIGKRTIRSLHLADDEHSLVKAFYELRIALVRGEDGSKNSRSFTPRSRG